MKNKLLLCIALLVAFNTMLIAQVYEDENERTEKLWAKFTAQGWHKIDFSKTLLTKDKLENINVSLDDEDDYGDEPPINELALLRGVVFGKRGRIFKSKSIQNYLNTQKWYKPNKDFSNDSLTKNERANLDLIRLAEAKENTYIQPGDMRIWRNKEIPEDKILPLTATGWRIIIAEVEAIHGKRFDDEPWLQTYFEKRYWYQPNVNYSPKVLNAFERKNLGKINEMRSKARKIAVSLGDMDKFQNVLLTRDMLKGLTLNELRQIRNEFFARNGYKFTFAGIAQDFEWRDWYQPLKDQSKVKLNETELKNIKLIEKTEKELREQMATTLIKQEMINGLFIEDLKVLRNEIYARRGRIFKDPKLQDYFAKQKWYKPNPNFKDEMLSKIESLNLKTIIYVEEEAMSRFYAFEG